MFFSTRSKAQENNAQPINISGTVVTVDTLGLKKKKAVDAAKRVREEKGLKSAVDLIEKYLISAPVYC